MIPPWSAYHTFMSRCLIALDKKTGARPFIVGEKLRHHFAKCVLRVTGPEAKKVCQDDQICARLKAGTDGNIYWVQAIWDTNHTTEYWICILVDKKNALNKINRIRMLWKFCNLWPSRDPLIFNYYYHWSSITLWNRNGTASFLHIREGMMKGDPLTMFEYGIIILPLMKKLK